ncbi:MAG: hypothetical protein JWR32_1512 [Mycobacterium sp.]|jgi:hypothetical protein|nr:hypothetical protein [Mycobacterium sp.]
MRNHTVDRSQPLIKSADAMAGTLDNANKPRGLNIHRAVSSASLS